MEFSLHQVLCDVFFLPETYAPALLAAKARKLRLKTGRRALHSKCELSTGSNFGTITELMRYSRDEGILDGSLSREKYTATLEVHIFYLQMMGIF